MTYGEGDDEYERACVSSVLVGKLLTRYLCHTYTFTAVYHHHESLILLASLKNLGVT